MAASRTTRLDFTWRRKNLIAVLVLLACGAAMLAWRMAGPAVSVESGLSVDDRRTGQVADKIDLNTASEASMRRLPGIGAATAAGIAKWRASHGGCPFRVLADVEAVRITTANQKQRRIPRNTVARLAPHLTLTTAPAQDNWEEQEP